MINYKSNFLITILALFGIVLLWNLSLNSTTIYTNADSLSYTFEINKDNITWDTDSINVSLYQDGLEVSTLTFVNGVATGVLTEGVYDVYVDNIDSNLDFNFGEQSGQTLNFELNYYTVVYDLNGGVGTIPVDNNVYLTGSSVSILSDNAITNGGYEINGWALSNAYENEPSFLSDGTSEFEIIEPTIFYANWQLKEAEITFVSSSLEIVYDGSSHMITITASHEIPTISYEWYRSASIDGKYDLAYDVQSFYANNVSNSGFYYCKVTVTDGVNYRSIQTDSIHIDIIQREIQISSISAVDRQYDGTKTVELIINEYSLVDDEVEGLPIIEGHDFNVAMVGAIGSKNFGQYLVSFLYYAETGVLKDNYIFINNFDEFEIYVNITKRDITINNVSALDKTYDGLTSISLYGGQLNGAIQGEELSFNLNYGTVQNKNVGKNLIVSTNIEIIDNDFSRNYNLIQPTYLKVNIAEKMLTITEITAQDKEYDGTNAIYVNCGNATITGIIDNDRVSCVFLNDSFTSLGYTISCDASNLSYFVTCEIKLTGEDKLNYTFNQPNYVKAYINKKNISLTNVRAVDRYYDGTDIVTLEGGVFQSGAIIGDDIVYVSYNHAGRISSSNASIHSYNVQVFNLFLYGTDCENYFISDIEYVTVFISPKIITIANIRAVNRLVNNTNVIELKGGNLVGILEDDDVDFMLYEGLTTSVSSGSNINVVTCIQLTGEDANNYTLLQPDDIHVNIVYNYSVILLLILGLILSICLFTLFYLILQRRKYNG